jgi:Flp pilus assembly protein TadD
MEAAAEATLRKGLARDPRSAELHHALGLSLVRQKRYSEAVRELAEASRLAPDSARYPYVYAVALNESGQRAQAIRVLEAAIAKHPYDRELLLAGSTYQRAAGNLPRALEHARRLREVDPENADAARLVADTETSLARPKSR